MIYSLPLSSGAFSILHPNWLSPATAALSLGGVLGLGEVDEDKLYQALDWLLQRLPAIEAALAKRHLNSGTLALYALSHQVKHE